MNKQYQEGTDSSQVTGLGKALRQGREGKNFSVSRVADGLHLRPSIVTAIEDENYELLPGDLFLKGYIRSYARLVGLDEGKMINLLDQRLSDQASEQAEKKQALGKAKRKKHSKHAVLFLVIAGIVGAAFYMWSQRLGDPNLEVYESANEPVKNLSVLDAEPSDMKESEIQGIVETVEPEKEMETAKPLEKTETTHDGGGVEDKLIHDPANEINLESTVDDSAPVADVIESGMTQVPVVEPKLKLQQESGLALKPVVDAEMLSTDKILDIGVVSVIFSGDCWFTLKNAEGKTVYADLKHAGDEINYSGPVPFTLVIGAVSEVRVVFDQEPIDFSTVRVRNNRAELVLTH